MIPHRNRNFVKKTELTEENELSKLIGWRLCLLLQNPVDHLGRQRHRETERQRETEIINSTDS